MPTVSITFDMGCCRCRAKIHKSLCCLQGVEYDNDKVLVSGPFNAIDLCCKLQCKTRCFATKIEIVPPPPPPKKKKKKKKEKNKDEPPMAPPKPPVGEPNPEPAKCKVIIPYPCPYPCASPCPTNPQPPCPSSCTTPRTCKCHSCRPPPPCPPPPPPCPPPVCNKCPIWTPCQCRGYPWVVCCEEKPDPGACAVM